MRSDTNHFLFKSLLVIQVFILFIYTAICIIQKGGNLFEVYLNDILSYNWNGQFNLDFSFYLMLSAIWIVWRNKYSIKSVLLASIAMIVGFLVFAPYILYLLKKENGSIKHVLIGKR